MPGLTWVVWFASVSLGRRTLEECREGRSTRNEIYQITEVSGRNVATSLEAHGKHIRDISAHGNESCAALPSARGREA